MTSTGDHLRQPLRPATSMHLLLLGGSGGCGRWVRRLALGRGHRVTTILRAPSPRDAQDAAVEIIGDVLDRELLRQAITADVDAVVSCLGIRRSNPRNPWSGIVGTHALVGPVAASLSLIIPASRVRRVVAVSSAGVGDSVDRTSPLLRWVFEHSNVRIAFDDLARMEQTFAASSTDWMAVRPTRLVDGPPTAQARECQHFGLTDSISRADVATWLLDVAERDAPIRDRTPMITQ